jgi:uncharacterized protein YecE (DUF72 family)
MSLFVGTSGWAYKEWKPDFYPADVPQSRFLEHYTQHLSACEINATFYRIQSEDAVRKWAQAAPEGFRYSIKAHRRITHSRRVAPSEEGRPILKEFLDSLRPMGERLGALLLQFPPTRQRDEEGLRALLAALPDVALAFEFRHDSWDDPVLQETIADAGGTVCYSDTGGDPPKALPPGPHAYVRLRTERYTEEQRRGWLELLLRESEKRDVFAFSKHEGIPARDQFGGIGLARWLREQART